MRIAGWIEVHALGDVSRSPFGCEEGASLSFNVRYISGVYAHGAVTHLLLTEKMYAQPVYESVQEVLAMIASAKAGE